MKHEKVRAQTLSPSRPTKRFVLLLSLLDSRIEQSFEEQRIQNGGGKE